MIYLLAYPRSGSSFFRYCLGYLTESKPMQPQGHCEIDHLLEKYYKKEPYIKKFHSPFEFSTRLSIKQNKGNKLALLHRDPLENIISYAVSGEHPNQKNLSEDYLDKFVNKTITNDNYTFNKYFRLYLENVNYYRQWNFEKTVVSYENLMLNPKEELLKHCDFFGYTKERVEEFMVNIEHHKSLMLKEKTKPSDPFSVNTQGKKLHKFKNILTEENLEMLQKTINSNVGVI